MFKKWSFGKENIPRCAALVLLHPGVTHWCENKIVLKCIFRDSFFSEMVIFFYCKLTYFSKKYASERRFTRPLNRFVHEGMNDILNVKVHLKTRRRGNVIIFK